jgi:sodium transport system permease protein
MKNIITIFKKEMKRFFTDRRMLAALFLPGILMYVLYSVMGNVMGSAISGSDTKNYNYTIVETNNYGDSTNQSKLDTYLKAALQSYEDSVEIKYINSSDVETYKVNLKANEYQLIIAFDDNFEINVKSGTKSNITLYYNGASNESAFIYNIAGSLIESAYGIYSVNLNKDGTAINPNVSEKNVTFLRIISFILPMVLLSLLSSTCLSLAPESIAGEKERGTLGLVLIAPIKRSELAIAKVLALTVTCMVSGITSFLGLIFSLPKMFNGLGEVNFNFGPLEIVGLLFIILSLLILLITFASFVSSFAKSIKEASGFLGPLTGLFVVAGILPAFLDITNIGYAFVPLLNSAACLSSIVSGTVNLTFVIISIVSNLFYSAVFAYLMVKMFNNENVMFNVH